MTPSDIIYEDMTERLVCQWADNKLGLPKGSVASVTLSQGEEWDYTFGGGGTLGSLTVVANFVGPIPMEVADYRRRAYGKRPEDWVANKTEQREWWPLSVDNIGQVIRELVALAEARQGAR